MIHEETVYKEVVREVAKVTKKTIVSQMKRILESWQEKPGFLTAKDIMVGDYVTLRESLENDESPLVVKVFSIAEDGTAVVSFDHDKTWDEVDMNFEFVGLPITGEILLENGFMPNKRVRSWYYTRGSVCVNWGTPGRVKVSCSGEKFGNRANFDCKYVHELQHIFHLFKIEKEIIL